jgi:4-amino-4-deoxy-L-arabinose transferase-like glycosyltransferase
MIKAKPKLQFTNIKLSKLLWYALLIGAISYILVYIWIVLQRLRYPFELEWIEGGMVDEVQQILNGKSIYVAPSMNFVPFLYPPLYFYLSALASKIFGEGLFPLRLVSFISSLFSFTTIFIIVHEETKNWGAAILSVGLFAATFRLTGAWMDIARVDSLFLALWLLFIYFIKKRKSLAFSMLAGAFAALAYLTKQTALIACLPIIIFLFLQDWKYTLVLVSTGVAIVGITVLVFNQMSQGWFSYYTFGLLSTQTEWVLSLITGFWYDDLFVHLPIVIPIVLFFLLAGKPNQNQTNLVQWFSIILGALAGTFFTRVKVGGYDNVLLPTYAVMAILFGLGLNELFTITNRLSPDYSNRVEVLICIVCFIQLSILYYNPNAQIPTNSD